MPMEWMKRSCGELAIMTSNPGSIHEKTVFLAGEGSNDLGGWCKETMHRNEVPYPGILETLLRKIKTEGWVIVDAIKWQYIRKYRAGDHGKPEEQNVRRACKMAKDKGCTIIAFSRDSDGNNQRVIDIQEGLKSANALWSDRLGIIGGCAVPCIEGWVLAIIGTRHTESYSRTKIESLIIGLGIEPKDTAAMVEKIEENGLANIPDDARSFKSWVELARSAL
jgi:hypothetical protein